MDKMKFAMPIAALLICGTLAGPALGQAASVLQGDIGSKGAIGVTDTRLQPDRRLDESEAEGEQLRLNGQCDKAVPILRAYATQGAGNEIAQFNLGMCLLDLAAAQHDAAQAAGRKEGADWIVQSANAGFAKAQARAVMLYLDGAGVAADPVEAAKWSILYHRNSTRIAIGLRDIAPQVSDRLDAALTDATRTQAQERADNWSQKAQAAQTADE
jgi:hypothetical protein